MQDKILNLLFEQDEITWQSILLDLVREEKMDPWDVDVSILTQRYITTLKSLKELDVRLGGKVLLAACLLLKIKSERLMGADLAELDRLFTAPEEMSEEEFYEGLESAGRNISYDEARKLIPRTPQMRKRKVSIYDLVNALEKALEVKQRRVLRSIPLGVMEIPHKSEDITLVMKRLYHKIVTLLTLGRKKIMFTNLIPDQASKNDKVRTFIPLLHLANQRKVDLYQERHFEDFEVLLAQTKKAVDLELGISAETEE